MTSYTRRRHETFPRTRQLKSVSESDTVSRTINAAFSANNLYTDLAQTTMDRGEEKHGKSVEHFVDEVITDNYEHETKDGIFELAPESAPDKRPTTTPGYNGYMVVPAIIITPPETSEAPPKDTEPVAPATTSSALHAGKVYLKPDVLYPPTPIECADSSLGYPLRPDSRSVLSADCGETLA